MSSLSVLTLDMVMTFLIQITDKLGFIKIKNCSVGNIKRRRRHATEWEEILAKGTSDKGLLFKIHKEVLKFNNRKTNNLIR